MSVVSLDFDHLYKMYSAKNTLQEHRVVIAEVYEAETLAVTFTQRQMTVAKLRQLFGERRWQEEVFACLSFRDQQSAEIELMNAESSLIDLSKSFRQSLVFFSHNQMVIRSRKIRA